MESDNQLVYQFSSKQSEWEGASKDLLGGKGANLAEMCRLGLPVPPGFTISTDYCIHFLSKGKILGENIKSQISSALKKLETLMGQEFGNPSNPLLLSVRSGAKVSMPGMMDTILNLGLNDECVEGLAIKSQNPFFAWDSYRRFIQMYAGVVMGMNSSFFESSLEDLKEVRGVEMDTELSVEDLKQLVEVYKGLILDELGYSFPQNIYDQLDEAIKAVFLSWNNSRAIKYREIHHYSDSWGTAVNIQCMVFGNKGEQSATGVAFTRNPSTGAKEYFGEYLINAQGEDVVAGIRTPAPINLSSRNEISKDLQTLEEVMPAIYKELVYVFDKLENHFRDMQDIEFTVEEGKLYLLQTRSGKRSSQAALKLVTSFVEEGVISEEEGLLRVDPETLSQLLHPQLDPKANFNIIAEGLPASPGAVSGKIALSAEVAQDMSERGLSVILVRAETSPEDIGGMVASKGILTGRGGMTSHAAVVARGMGRPCIVGCSDLILYGTDGKFHLGSKILQEGDEITLDGGTGKIMSGVIPTILAKMDKEFTSFIAMADKYRKLRVRVNADNSADCEVAKSYGAEGIGLCRTEHMFFSPERILAVREMIFSETTKERECALKKLLPFQKEDFVGIFRKMAGLPVNIRLLDPPLHEFMPHSKAEIKELASAFNIDEKAVELRIESLKEFNPMLGHRGCRLGVTYPEIYKMQVRAIIEAALLVQADGEEIFPEIMIPLIFSKNELEYIKKGAISEIENIFDETGKQIKYKIGTMIEFPRAAITAGEIAPMADFFSFGTNDLTQTTFGLSRDDAGKFLPAYVSQFNILEHDPFVRIDRDGIGFLLEKATKDGREKNPNLHVGICGEHGGDPNSIEFCHQLELDYVSCSPFRIPVAKLAAAQAAIKYKNG